jgi:hypothetical protein
MQSNDEGSSHRKCRVTEARDRPVSTAQLRRPRLPARQARAGMFECSTLGVGPCEVMDQDVAIDLVIFYVTGKLAPSRHSPSNPSQILMLQTRVWCCDTKPLPLPPCASS